jgi:two-component system, NarL family, nitrate/nitrite response regulator NarL
MGRPAWRETDSLRLNGLEAVTRAADDFPNVRVVILSRHANEEYVLRALKAGAGGRYCS